MRGWVIVAYAALLCACASAGTTEDDSDRSDDPGPDAARSTDLPDAAPLPELPDAAPPVQIPDAAPTSSADAGLFCNSSSECTVAGECCFTLGQPPGFCVPGQEQLGICVPN